MRKLWFPCLFALVIFGLLLLGFWEEEGWWGVFKIVFMVVAGIAILVTVAVQFGDHQDHEKDIDANALLWEEFNREQRARKELERLSKDE